MRTYIRAQYDPPVKGDFRTVEKFAWWPKKIITFQGQNQGRGLTNYYWVWLEKYKEEQEYVEVEVPSLHGIFMVKTGYCNWKSRRIFQ